MDDLYSDNPSGETEAPEDKNTDEEGETFLVSKSALGGKEPKPGEKCEFEAVKTYEDEIEFKYVGHSEGENPEMDKANADLGEMAE